mmetsp:Transcript_32274/g.92926  ORF Transcript_32274/g.92926 Transcript_32274/m.92926 type:complete len:218 (+) Transcript_32274:372-1025(+)
MPNLWKSAEACGKPWPSSTPLPWNCCANAAPDPQFSGASAPLHSMPTAWKPSPWLPNFEGTHTWLVITRSSERCIASVTRGSQPPSVHKRPHNGELQHRLSTVCKAPPWWQLPTKVTDWMGFPAAGEAQPSSFTISRIRPETCMRFASLNGARHQYFLATKGSVRKTRSSTETLNGKRLLLESVSSSPQGNSSSMNSLLNVTPLTKSWYMSCRTRPA